tara:strand:+ start:788 stop:895 length:108 start_codon:yes stop_codon:yes gene_type:complete
VPRGGHINEGEEEGERKRWTGKKEGREREREGEID